LEEETEQDSEDFDILAWWKINAKKFPILSAMVCDFLAIPLSTVASESTFSCGGRILGYTKSSRNLEMLEALVCARDWLYKPKQTNNEGKMVKIFTNLHVSLSENYSFTSNWARATHTCEILKLENMDEDGCYVQLYFSMINCQVSYHRICPLHP
jgi:hypothetical protein